MPTKAAELAAETSCRCPEQCKSFRRALTFDKLITHVGIRERRFLRRWRRACHLLRRRRRSSKSRREAKKINERENMIKAGVGNMSRLKRRSVPLRHDCEKAAVVLRETKVVKSSSSLKFNFNVQKKLLCNLSFQDFNKNISRAVQDCRVASLSALSSNNNTKQISRMSTCRTDTFGESCP